MFDDLANVCLSKRELCGCALSVSVFVLCSFYVLLFSLFCLSKNLLLSPPCLDFAPIYKKQTNKDKQRQRQRQIQRQKTRLKKKKTKSKTKLIKTKHRQKAAKTPDWKSLHSGFDHFTSRYGLFDDLSSD